jgi:hypothetical protein
MRKLFTIKRKKEDAGHGPRLPWFCASAALWFNFQLLVQNLVWTAGRPGSKDAGERDFPAADLLQFILGDWPGSPSNEYPVIVVRHLFLLSIACASYESSFWSGLPAVLVTMTLRSVRLLQRSVRFHPEKAGEHPAGEHPVVIVWHVVSFSAFSKPGGNQLVRSKGDKCYVSKLWSGLLDVPVTSVLRRVGIKPPDTPSSSS